VTSEPLQNAKNGEKWRKMPSFVLSCPIFCYRLHNRIIGSGIVRFSLSLFLFSLPHFLSFLLMSSPQPVLPPVSRSLLRFVGSCGCCCSAGEETPDTDGKPAVELVNVATPTLESLMEEIARLRRDNNLK
jgi:hypothetical protein